MFNTFKLAGAAFALTVAAGAASAATVTGDIDFAGKIDASTTTIASGGFIDIDETALTAPLASSGDFVGTSVTIADFDLSTVGVALLSLSNGLSFIVDSFTGFTIDGDSTSFTALGTLTGGGFTDTAATFSFANIDTALSSVDQDFYVAELSVNENNVSPVPLPAAGFLLIGALGGLAAAGRRKAK